MKKRGPPFRGVSPEYQEVLRLYLAGVRPCEIAGSLGRTRRWAYSAVQRLRRAGVLGPEDRVKTGRTPGVSRGE